MLSCAHPTLTLRSLDAFSTLSCAFCSFHKLCATFTTLTTFTTHGDRPCWAVAHPAFACRYSALAGEGARTPASFHINRVEQGQPVPRLVRGDRPPSSPGGRHTGLAGGKMNV